MNGSNDELAALVTGEMRACIGTTTAPLQLPEEISASDVRHFVSVIGETNPIYSDEAYAQRYGYERCVVPPLFVVVSFHRLTEPGSTRRPGLDWPGLTLPPGFTNTRNSGQEYVWFRPVYVGDRLTITIRLADILARRTRTGLPMILLVSEVEMRNQHGDLVLRQTNHDAKLATSAYIGGEAS
jgi:acyl dehydratase